MDIRRWGIVLGLAGALAGCGDDEPAGPRADAGPAEDAGVVEEDAGLLDDAGEGEDAGGGTPTVRTLPTHGSACANTPIWSTNGYAWTCSCHASCPGVAVLPSDTITCQPRAASTSLI